MSYGNRLPRGKQLIATEAHSGEPSGDEIDRNFIISKVSSTLYVRFRSMQQTERNLHDSQNDQVL